MLSDVIQKKNLTQNMTCCTIVLKQNKKVTSDLQQEAVIAIVNTILVCTMTDYKSCMFPVLDRAN